MLHAEIAQNPARQHDERLEQDVLMHIPTAACHLENTTIKHIGCTAQDDERQENQTGEKCIKKQNWYNGVTLKSLFL